MNKKEARVRRARKTRIRIAEQRATRLVVGRSNSHIYAQIVAPTGDKVLVSASTLEADVRKDLKNGGNKAAAAVIGKRIAEKAKALGHRGGRVRPCGFSLPWPREGAGRRRPRGRSQVLSRGFDSWHSNDPTPASRSSRTTAATGCERR